MHLVRIIYNIYDLKIRFIIERIYYLRDKRHALWRVSYKDVCDRDVELRKNVKWRGLKF